MVKEVSANSILQEHVAERRTEAFRQRRSRGERNQHWKKRSFVDERRQLRPPKERRRVPIAKCG